MALSANRNTPRREREIENHPVKAATTIFQGSIVALDATGWAIPGATATGLIVVGCAQEQVANSGGNGALRIETRRGVFRFKNSASGDLIARAEIGDQAYLVDDETVAKTNGSSTRSVAGIIRDVDAQGVWVEI